MSYFETKLDVSLVNGSAEQGRGVWQLDSELRYYSSLAHRWVIAPRGFKTDFASVPRLPFVFLLDGDTCAQAAVVHDYLYTAKPLSRREADAVLREACKATGAPAWRRWTIWAGVRLFGGNPWRGKSWDKL